MIVIKNARQQDGIRRSGELLSQAFARISKIIAPGVSARQLDRAAEDVIRAGGGIPSFLGYRGFPASICTSVNEQVIHGIPDNKPLRDGDIIGCDIGVIRDGYYSDACKTFPVGKIDEDSRILLEVTRKALHAAIDICYAGSRVKDIGKAVTRVVKPYNFGIVYTYCGHGVGLDVHEAPEIPNYYPSPGKNPRLKPGMVLAIEPMINAGAPEVELLEDGWTVVTADGSRSAHFEHSVLITDGEPKILTNWGV